MDVLRFQRQMNQTKTQESVSRIPMAGQRMGLAPWVRGSRRPAGQIDIFWGYCRSGRGAAATT
ncbi:MAG: hypothetical protein OJF48_002475 [Afipia sp.]|nr:MAG: hypothetical protein OJF48_002475 [Afipia sp.]